MGKEEKEGGGGGGGEYDGFRLLFSIILSWFFLRLQTAEVYIQCLAVYSKHSDKYQEKVFVDTPIWSILKKHSEDRMEYATGIILAQTVVVCIISTIAIMWCFFEEEPRKQKTD